MPVTEIVLAVLGAAGGSAVVVCAFAAWLGKVWGDRIAQAQKLSQVIDIDLRKRRIDVYQELWTSTSILPKWPKAEGVTYEQLLQFSQELRAWYFSKGGMYLSRSTHDKACSPLQPALEELLRTHTSGVLSDVHYESIRSRCSTLRTALASDIQSRREGPQ